jgi:hypothetical protein
MVFVNPPAIEGFKEKNGPLSCLLAKANPKMNQCAAFSCLEHLVLIHRAVYWD